MGSIPFGKKDTVVPPEPAPDLLVGKGRATPTRREREAANLRPLVQSDRKAANKASRAKMAEAREKARIGMANGDERFLPMRDRGPQRRFARDYVDARFSVGEILLPVMFLFLLTSMIPGIEAYAFITVWVFFLVVILDAMFAGVLVTRALKAKTGSAQKGLRWYVAMRAIQLRPMRLPKPQVKRGAYPE